MNSTTTRPEIETLADGTCACCGEELEEHSDEELTGCAEALRDLRDAE